MRLLVIGRGDARLGPGIDRTLRRASSSEPCGHDQIGLEPQFLSPARRRLGQAPAGALNENRRGSISSIVKPETGHAKRAENVMRSWVSFLF